MIYKSLINRLKIICKHDYEKFNKMQGKRKFYDIEDDQNPLTNKIPLRKTKRSKKMPKDQTESKSAYLSISKSKAKQFQR